VLNNIAVDTRPSAGAKFEIEAGDDFILTTSTAINHATFTGLLTNPTFSGGIPLSSVNSVTVEIYRVFPNDSDVGRTSGPPLFSTSKVPTRVNSPSDVEFDDRNSPAGTLKFTVTPLGTFTGAANSVKPGGIHAFPNQTTLGNGPVTGTEVVFDVNFTTPFTLPADHYFFVPQVDVSGGEFMWLNATRPIDATGTPFAPDLQSWTRDQFLQPDWLRVGTDIVGAGTFNQAFTLDGTSFVPEPATWALLGLGIAGLAAARRLRRRGTASAGRQA
jgi:hypothetical protein